MPTGKGAFVSQFAQATLTPNRRARAADGYASGINVLSRVKLQFAHSYG